MIYKFREGYSLPVPAQVVGEHIAKIERRVGREFGAHHLVEDGKSPASPIHSCFDWNDTTAAEKWRMGQARRMLQSIEEVIINERGVEVHRIAYVSVSEGPSNYMNIQSAMSDKDIAEHVIDEATVALAGWRRRYGHLVKVAKEFGEVVDAIDRFTQQQGTTTDGTRKGKDRRTAATINKRPRQPVASSA